MKVDKEIFCKVVFTLPTQSPYGLISPVVTTSVMVVGKEDAGDTRESIEDFVKGVVLREYPAAEDIIVFGLDK